MVQWGVKENQPPQVQEACTCCLMSAQKASHDQFDVGSQKEAVQEAVGFRFSFAIPVTGAGLLQRAAAALVGGQRHYSRATYGAPLQPTDLQ